MNAIELKVARIGNSRGVRLPAATLRRYGVAAALWMEERSDGIMLRPVANAPLKLSWEETAREMAAAAEDWGAWDAAAGDGLAAVPWDAQPVRAAEKRAVYRARRGGKVRS